MKKAVDQPKNTKTDGVTLKWNPSFSKTRSEQFSNAQKSIDSDVIRLCWPLVPFDKGILNNSSLLNTVMGSGLVVYVTPYAAKMYYNPQLNFQGGPIRGAYWFERMKGKDLPEIKRNAGKELK